MKKEYIFSIALFLFCVLTPKAQIVDNLIDDPGDIVIIGYHDSPDGFSFVFLDNCPDGTSIRFIDEEWTGVKFASTTTEGEVLWTNNSGGTIVQGTVVNIERADDNGAGILASVGLATEIDGGFSLDLTDDEIIAVTGTRSAPGVFLAFYGDDYISGNTLSGTSLVNGTTALRDAAVTEGRYTGVTNCSGLNVIECAQRLNDKNNWTFGSFSYPADMITFLDVSGTLTIPKTKTQKFQYYPNPAKDKLQVSSKDPIHRVTVFNLLGRELIKKNGGENTLEIDVSHLSSGVYYMKIEVIGKVEVVSFQKK